MTIDAVVIGTGFGGAVSALRLTQAGFRVTMLERGRRYSRGSFPRNWKDPLDGWLWEHGQGLIDPKPISGIQVVQAAGYGGGSLIYANVHLRAPGAVFDKRWPKAYSREVLDPYYDLVAHMLDLQQYPENGASAAKVRLMREAARALGREKQLIHTPLAVRFGPAGESKNRFGVTQGHCTDCGECDIGCNEHAKNTLDLNYLALAEQGGAQVQTQCEARLIEPLPDGYRVHYRDHAARADRVIEARKVFVCAGAVNSTELLFRSRARLPRLSDALGYHYSGNGDFLAFAFRTRDAGRPFVGPTITTGIVYERGEGDNKVWFIAQDGGIPKEVSALLGFLDPSLGWLKNQVITARRELETMVRLAGTNTRTGAPDPNVAVFLAMGRDRSDGRLTYSPVTNELCAEWPVLDNLPLYSAEERLLDDIARELGGKLALNPFWRRLRLPVTVHSLGGCSMADHPSDGVTDGYGEVHYYPGLYVLDGGTLPCATGVNPSHTIAAVAERSIEHSIRIWKRDPSWRAPEAQEAKPYQDPLDRVSILVPPGTPAPVSAPIGLQFTETMRGHISIPSQAERAATAPVPPAAENSNSREAIDYRQAEVSGKRDKREASFTLTIAMSDLNAFLSDKDHAASAIGRLHLSGLTPTTGAPVTAGLFNLFVEVNGSQNARKMIYVLPFVGADGESYVLEGFKAVQGNLLQIWPATSTLYTTVRRVDAGASSPPVAAGILHIEIPDFLKQLTTFRVSGTPDLDRQIEAFGRFGALFAGTLAKVFRPHYVGALDLT